MEYREVGYSEGLLSFEGSQTDNPLDMGTVKNKEFYLGLGVSPNVDLFYRLPEESTGLLGLKVQVLGGPAKARENGNKLAFTIGMGANRDTFKGTYEVELKSQAQEYSLVHGYRFSPLILVYEGISLSKYTFSGNIKEAPASFSTDSFEYKAQNILGFNLGLELGSPSFKLKLEYGTQKIEWTNTDSTLHQSISYALSAAF